MSQTVYKSRSLHLYRTRMGESGDVIVLMTESPLSSPHLIDMVSAKRGGADGMIATVEELVGELEKVLALLRTGVA